MADIDNAQQQVVASQLEAGSYEKPTLEVMPIEQVVAAGASGVNDFGSFEQAG